MEQTRTTSCPNCFAEVAIGAQCMTPRCAPAAVVPPPTTALVPYQEWPHIQQTNVPFALALSHMQSHPAVRYKMDLGGPVSNGPECEYFRWDRDRDQLTIFLHGSECCANARLIPKWSAGALCTRLS